MIRGNPSWLRQTEVPTKKVFVIKENFPADGGHKITIIKGAEDNEQALTLYKEGE